MPGPTDWPPFFQALVQAMQQQPGQGGERFGGVEAVPEEAAVDSALNAVA